MRLYQGSREGTNGCEVSLSDVAKSFATRRIRQELEVVRIFVCDPPTALATAAEARLRLGDLIGQLDLKLILDAAVKHHAGGREAILRAAAESLRRHHCWDDTEIPDQVVSGMRPRRWSWRSLIWEYASHRSYVRRRRQPPISLLAHDFRHQANKLATLLRREDQACQRLTQIQALKDEACGLLDGSIEPEVRPTAPSVANRQFGRKELGRVA